MPIFHTPHASTSSGASYSDAASRFSFASETSRQVIDADHHETRKRRNGDYDASSIRGFTANPWSAGTSSAFSHFDSPAPLAHDRYTLAGGSMEGTSSLTRQNGNYDDYFNLQSQRGMWSSPTSPSLQPMALDRVAAIPIAPSSWMVDSLLTLVGGVAGTLFKFCTVPFRGFQAGGGQSYDADAQIKIASRLGLHDEPAPSEPAAPVQQINFNTRPSPIDDYGIRSIDSVDTERPRMPKRLRTEDAWVMVGTNEEPPTPITTPRTSARRTPRPTHTPSPSQIPRPQSRTTTPLSTRPSLIPISRRSTQIRSPLYSSISNSNSNPHPRQRSHSRLSLSSTGTSADDKKKPSPLPADSQKLVSRIRREEMEDDARMRRMSSQMSAMLREAREALGSKVEIEDEDQDMLA